MTIKYIFNRCIQFGLAGLASCLSITIFTSKTLAQLSNIVPDNTMGAESSQVISIFQGKPIQLITGGASRGINLFHSFREFNINTGAEAYFFNSNANIQNIFARVTGSNRSEILGKLGTFGSSSPNLFLMNPNGIVFGKDASLNVQGSFVGTTANAITFGNQGVFSATTPEVPLLLTINPSALFFNKINQAASITNQSQAAAGVNQIAQNTTGLRVLDGKSLLLVGRVNIDGGILAYGGNIEFAGLSSPGSIGLNIAGDNLSLIMPENVERADVSLSNAAEVNVRGSNGGNVKIQARNVNLAGGSKIRAGIDTGLGTPNSKSGDITINATGDTTVTDKSFIANVIQPEAFGKGGDINISTRTLTLSDGGLINDNISGQGNGGKININAQGAVTIVGQKDDFISGINSVVSTGAIGNAGNINISAERLALSDGGAISSLVDESSFAGNAGNIKIVTGTLKVTNGAAISNSTAGKGNAGDININAHNNVTLSNSKVGSDVSDTGLGNGGTIQVTTGSLSVTNGAQISSTTNGHGNAGNININARDNITIAGFEGKFGSQVSSLGLSSAIGNGGDIRITAGSLLLKDSGNIEANNSGQGNGGNIFLDVGDTINFDGTAGNGLLPSNATTFASNGNAGNIQVNTGSLFLTNGSLMSSSQLGEKGNAGNITINARDTVKIDGEAKGVNVSGGLTSSLLNGEGKGGDIHITTGSLFVTNGASLTAFSQAQGNGGNIFIDSRDVVAFDGGNSQNHPSLATTAAIGSGNAGNIQVKTGSLMLTNGGVIDTEAKRNAGSINIDARDMIIINGVGNNNNIPRGIFSNLVSGGIGKGGDVNIFTGSLDVTNGAYLGVSTYGKGDSGNITINARDAIKFDGAGAYSTVESTSVGNAGNIKLTTNSLLLSNGGQLSAATAGKGNAGDININARDRLTLDGSNNNGRVSGIYSSTVPGSVGKGGSIFIDPSQVTIRNGANISVNSAGNGNAGNIMLKGGTLTLDNGASISAQTTSSEGGNIDLQLSDNLLMRRGSIISTSAGTAQAGGNGGSISISSKYIIAFLKENSDITANAFSGNGGRVKINSQGIFGIESRPKPTPESDITASSQKGISGVVNINAPDTSSIQNSFIGLFPVINTNTLIAHSCISRGAKRRENSFTITGSGALPNGPGDSLISAYTTGEVRGVDSRPWKKGDPIVEPQGVYRLNNGQLLLSRQCSD